MWRVMLMYTLVIADDEARIRKGFEKIVSWEEIGYEVRGCYADGAQVIEHLARDHVDVVLTDISMPGMSGLEVARVIHEEYPNTLCVLMSAYQEFDFAHQAIALDVEDYLLKPTRISDIKRVFTRIYDKLQKESEAISRMDEDRQRHKELDELMREQFLYDLFMRSMRDEKSVGQQAAYLYPDIKKPALIVFIWRTEGARDTHSDEWLRRALSGECEGVKYAPASVEKTRVVALAVCERERAHDAERAVKSEINETLSQLEGITGLKFSEPYSRVYDSLVDFSVRSYNSHGGESKGELSEAEREYLREQQRLMLGYMLSGSFVQAETMMENILTYISCLSLPARKGLLVDAFVRMREKLLEMGAAQLEAPEYAPLIMARTPEAVTGYCAKLLRAWQDALGVRGEDACQEIREYVKKHYSEPISLETVAEQVFLSPVYVSRMFKQETGINFSDYLLNARMEQAKRLLSGSACKVYEVGKRVGYPNPRYFYRVFKAYTGKTPSEYREK